MCFPHYLVSFITKDNQRIFYLLYFLQSVFSKEEVSEFFIQVHLRGESDTTTDTQSFHLRSQNLSVAPA